MCRGRHEPRAHITPHERDQLHEAVLVAARRHEGGPGWIARLALHLGDVFDRAELGDTSVAEWVAQEADAFEARRSLVRSGKKRQPLVQPDANAAGAGADAVV